MAFLKRHLNNIRHHNKGFAKLLLISYLSITLIIVSIFLFNQIVAIMVINDNVVQLNKSVLSLVQNDIDNSLREIESVVLSVGHQNDFKKFYGLKQPFTSEDRYFTREFIDELEKRRIFTDSFGENSYIYFSNSSVVLSLSSGVVIDVQSAYDKYHLNSSLDYANWNVVLQKRNYGHCIMTTDEEGNDRIYCVYSFPVEDKGVPKAVFFAEVNIKNLISSHYDNNYIDNSVVYAINEKNEKVTLYGNSDAKNDNFDFNEISSNDEEFVFEKGQNKTMMMYCSSNQSKLKYVVRVSDKLINKSRNKLILNMALCIFFAIFAGVGLTLIFTKKHYKPVREILDKLGANHLSCEKDTNEFSLITSYINKGIDTSRKNALLIRKYDDMLKNNFLNLLLSGRIDDGQFTQNLFEKYSVVFEFDDFIVVLFKIDNVAKDDEYRFETNDAIYAVLNIIKDLFCDKYLCYATQINEDVALIINLETDNDVEEIKQRVQWLCVFSKESLAFNINAVAGGIHSDIKGISKSYFNCGELFEYKKLMNVSDILFYDDVIKNDNKSYLYQYSQKYRNQLINFIKIGDYPSAKDIVNKEIEDEIRHSGMPINLLKSRAFSLVDTILSAINDAEFQSGKIFLDKLNPIERLINCNSLDDIKTQTYYIFDKVKEYMEDIKNKSGNKMIEEVIDYIETHYQDSNISVTSVADKFNIPLNKLSASFKAYCNVGLLDYIHRKRIENSKKLLGKKDLSISQIALNVGYIDSDSYIKKFKKYEGITPGRYREIKMNID